MRDARVRARFQGGSESLATSSAAGLALITGVVGIFVGWNFRTARGANADLKVHKGRIPVLSRKRNRKGLCSIVLLALGVLFLTAGARGQSTSGMEPSQLRFGLRRKPG